MNRLRRVDWVVVILITAAVIVWAHIAIAIARTP